MQPAENSPVMPPGNPLDDRGPGLRNFLIFLVMLTAVSAGLRFWSRMLMSAESRGIPRFWWDDWLAFSAVPFIIASGAVMFDMLRLGLGRHIWAIEPTHILPLMNRLFAVYYAYNTGLVLAKASGLLFYQRVFSAPTVYRWFSVALNATHALNFGTYMGNIYLITFNNTPKAQMSTGWRPDTASLWLSAAIPSVVTDLIILFLPMPMIWKLRIGPLRKFAVFCIFVCGYSVVVVALGRLISLAQKPHLADDLTYEGITSIYWQAAEGPMTLMCVCLPAMPSLVRKAAGLVKGNMPNVSWNGRTLLGTGGSTNTGKSGNSSATLSSKPIIYGKRPLLGDEEASLHGSERMMLKPMPKDQSYSATVSVPERVSVRDNRHLSSNIHIQRDIDVTIASDHGSDRG